MSRRRFLACGALSLVGLSSSLAQVANDGGAPEKTPDGAQAKDMITPAAQRCIDRGLEYLARSQHADGSFGERQHQGNVAVTSLGALALMAGGHQPGRGAYGKAVGDALQAVLAREDPQKPGYFHKPSANNHGPMYEHGFGTLFLAEVHGMVPGKELRAKLRDKLKAAIELIVKCQNGEGGWRYHPVPKDADLSVTICQIMALRAARNAGIYVPKSTVDKCTEYVKACQDIQGGGFRYMKQGSPTGFARTAAGVVALYSAGIYKGPEVERGLRYLQQQKPSLGFAAHRIHDMHYFYGHYYAAQAMWTAGGAYWAEWYPAIREELINRAGARSDGAWSDSICPHYATAMACIILQIPNNYLPILQK